MTHIFPDLDAIGAAWLLVRFDPDYTETKFEFVPAGQTYKNKIVDSDPDVVHVDTGMGRFDHHQIKALTSATELVFNYLKQEKLISLKYQSGVNRLVKYVTEIDNFKDFFWPEASADRYDLTIDSLINNLKMSGKLTDQELMYQGMLLLDAAMTTMMIKTKAETDIENGIIFESKWGKSLGFLSKHSMSVKLAQKKGFQLVIKKEPKTGFVSIKSPPQQGLELDKIYDQLVKKDEKSSWFFHQSRHIIGNGSRHNKQVKATKLSLEEIIEIIKNI